MTLAHDLLSIRRRIEQLRLAAQQGVLPQDEPFEPIYSELALLQQECGEALHALPNEHVWIVGIRDMGGRAWRIQHDGDGDSDVRDDDEDK